MTNSNSFVYESPESQPSRPIRETKTIPFLGAFSVGDDRTVFLCQFRLVTPENPKGVSFGRETMDKVFAILAADAAAQGGTVKAVPQTPMIRTQVQTASGRQVSNTAFITRLLNLAENSGLKFKERQVTQTPEAPAVDQTGSSDNVPF